MRSLIAHGWDRTMSVPQRLVILTLSEVEGEGPAALPAAAHPPEPFNHKPFAKLTSQTSHPLRSNSCFCLSPRSFAFSAPLRFPLLLPLLSSQQNPFPPRGLQNNFSETGQICVVKPPRGQLFPPTPTIQTQSPPKKVCTFTPCHSLSLN
jgi:hypothetical protein